MKNSRLVYSTEQGGKVSEENKSAEPQLDGDGIVRLRLETKGRKGAGVSIVNGVPLPNTELKKLAKELKKACGTGGSIKDGEIEIQGDNREKIRTFLEKKGFTVKG
ncbi:MAG: stress response translation initiation inhibitor YciH [Cellvibrionaceae bacterium]